MMMTIAMAKDDPDRQAHLGHCRKSVPYLSALLRSQREGDSEWPQYRPSPGNDRRKLPGEDACLCTRSQRIDVDGFSRNRVANGQDQQ